MKLDAKSVRKLFDYSPATGVLTWRERKVRLPPLARIDRGWNTRFVGEPAGRPSRHGHLYTNITYPLNTPRNYANHRLAWAHYYGEWPERGLDHKNGNPKDNRIDNLRLATQVQNMRNACRRRDNTSGHRGVSWSKKSRKWYAYINHGGKMRPLGLFGQKEDAIKARAEAALEIFGDFAREA